MQIITGTTTFDFHKDSAVAIGKFDGVHLGHQRILSEILAQKDKGMQAVVMTFDPSPEIFFGINPLPELSTRDEKREFFGNMGIDVLVEFPFNRETAATPPDKFVSEILFKSMRTRFVAAGDDLSFGDRGRGNFALLSSMARELGFKAKKIDKIEMAGHIISSTLIRKLVERGEMEKAAMFLGRPYQITGKVVHGTALGREIGIPTLNHEPAPEKLLPPRGVYYSTVLVDGMLLDGMTNIGVKPTVSDTGSVTAETFLYDFDGDLYGETADVSLLSFRRPEKRFDSVGELQRTIEQDIRAGEIFHAKRQKI